MESQETSKLHWWYKALNVCKSGITQVQPLTAHWEVRHLYLAGWDSEEKYVSILSHISAVLYDRTESPWHRDGSILQSHTSIMFLLQEAHLQLSLQSSSGMSGWEGKKEKKLLTWCLWKYHSCICPVEVADSSSRLTINSTISLCRSDLLKSDLMFL